MTYGNLEALKKFAQNPKIKTWYEGVAPELKESTRHEYLIFLMRYFNNEKPEDFLKRAEKDPKAVAIEIKSRIGEIYSKSIMTAHLTRYALKNFLTFHEVEIHLNGKVKVRRVRKKGELKWLDAEKIVSFCDEPYRSLFTFQLWSGLGEDEIFEIQRSPDIQRSIEQQRENRYVKIELEPRKSTLDEYYTLAPSELTPKFPVKTRTGSPVDAHDVQAVWRRAAKKAGLYRVGLGVHTLRSSFRSQCGKAEVASSVCEFFMGHGGSDKYGYGREILDQDYAAKEIGKLWTYNRGGSSEAYADLQAQVKELTEWKTKHEALIKELEKEYKT